MEVSTRSVKGGGMVIGCGLILLSRQLAESNQAVPSTERIERAKSCFVELGLVGASTLIEAIQMIESRETVVGYFGFTIDKEGLTRKPLAEGETDGERGMKIMLLPHPQWGNRRGTTTTLGGLVSLAEDLKSERMPPEPTAILSQVFEEAAVFISRGTSEDEV